MAKSVCKPDVKHKMIPKKPIQTQLVTCQQINQLNFDLSLCHFWDFLSSGLALLFFLSLFFLFQSRISIQIFKQNQSPLTFYKHCIMIFYIIVIESQNIRARVNLSDYLSDYHSVYKTQTETKKEKVIHQVCILLSTDNCIENTDLEV